MPFSYISEGFSNWLAKALELSEQLSPDRRDLLTQAAVNTLPLLQAPSIANLLFVCTHNSRRSQFGHFWAAVAANYYGMQQLRCGSCGTEATECNSRSIASLQRAGVQVESSGGFNPIYRCTFSPDFESIELYSKAFGHPSLPTSNIVGMMCCDDADTRCPTIPGALSRTALHYRDPKTSDDTSVQEATYDERSLQIAAEMLFFVRHMSKASN